ncbi:ferric reductase NAD binding domain-containing protein [Trichoderma compactum]
MDMGGDSLSSSAPLAASGVDFSNETQAFHFLQEILDDSVLGPVGNQYARYFWYGVMVVIGIASICNFVQRCVLRMRLRASARNRSRPAKPANPLTQSIATAAALLREPSYPQITPLAASSWLRVPPLGHVYIITAYLAFILALVLINNNIPGAQHFQALGTSLISFLVNSSVERLNVYHRWVSRGLLLLATLHFGLQSHAWNIYGLMALEWQTDACAPTGMAAYALLLWINLTSLAPLRLFKYKLFVVQHLLTYFGFTTAIVYHLYGTSSPYSTNYIYISIALYLVCQLIRFVRMIIVNIRPSRAALAPLEGSATKIRLSNPGIKSWQAGSFTKRLLKAAQIEGHQSMHLTLIDGPYPSPHADFTCFDTLVLIAGSTGVTFTLSVLQDIAQRAKTHKILPLRTLHFTWVIKHQSWISWVSEELRTAISMLQEAGVETLCNIHITAEEGIVGDEESAGRGQSQEQEKEQDGEADGRPVPDDEKVETSESQNRRTSDADIPLAELHVGRPTFRTMLERRVNQAQGETAVAVCGPLGLSVAVRSAVVRISDDLAVDKGSGLDGLYLHVENFD